MNGWSQDSLVSSIELSYMESPVQDGTSFVGNQSEAEADPGEHRQRLTEK